jgi:hypothetical protein
MAGKRHDKTQTFQITEADRKKRNAVLNALVDGPMGKRRLELIVAEPANGFLIRNDDLPIFEDDGGRLHLRKLGQRWPGSPLLANHVTHNIGGIHALRG